MLGYYPSKIVPHDHGIKDAFIFLAKSIIFCAAGKKILCWSMFATEPIADFHMFLAYWYTLCGLNYS